MEGATGSLIGFASTQFTGGSDFISGYIFSIPKGIQNALRTIESLICVGMDGCSNRHNFSPLKIYVFSF